MSLEKVLQDLAGRTWHAMSLRTGVEFIVMPFGRIFADVLALKFQIAFVTNDVLVKTRLPDVRWATSFFANGPGDGAFVSADNGAQ